MRNFGESMRQLSRTFSDEGEQLLNPDETPEDFGVSLSQLRHLAEVHNCLSRGALAERDSNHHIT